MCCPLAPHPAYPSDTYIDEGHDPEGIGHVVLRPILWGQPRDRLVGPRLSSYVVLAQDLGGMEWVASGGGIDRAIGRKAIGL